MKSSSLLLIALTSLLASLSLPAQETNTPTASEPAPSNDATPASGPAVVSMEKKAENNLFRNGNFADGKTGWRGKGKVVDIDGGRKALEVDFGDRTAALFNTVLRPESSTKIIKISFKVRMMPASGGDSTSCVFHMRVLNPRENMYYYYRYPLKANGEFQSFTGTYHVTTHNDLPIEFEPKDGKGAIQFTDVVAEEL